MMIVLVDEIERDLGAVHGHIMVACISTTNINHQLLYAKIAHTLVFFFFHWNTQSQNQLDSPFCATEHQNLGQKHAVIMELEE